MTWQKLMRIIRYHLKNNKNITCVNFGSITSISTKMIKVEYSCKTFTKLLLLLNIAILGENLVGLFLSLKYALREIFF